jgi:hypothetical protein
MPNFTLESRAKSMSDIQLTYRWELQFPNITKVVDGITDDEPLIIRCRNVTIPGFSNEVIESNFMGSTQRFPGRLKFTPSIEAVFEETQDMTISKAINSWKDKIFNADPVGPNAGSAEGSSKRDGQSIDAYLKLYKATNEESEKTFRLFNVFPTNVADVSLDYTVSDSVKYAVTFNIDLFTLLDS